MPYLGLGLGMQRVRSLLSYIRDGLVGNWSTFIGENTTQLNDLSGEGNTATVYSGRHFTTNGSTDKGIRADCSAAGASTYKLTGKIRGDGTGTEYVTVDGTNGLAITIASTNVWQNFESEVSGSVTPDEVVVGWGGTSEGFSGIESDWSDVRLIDTATGETVAHWQGTESAAADLDGYPVLDSSGNGYHGTHVGCAGGTQEGVDSALLKPDFVANSDKSYFNPSLSASFVSFNPVTTLSNGYVEMQIVANPSQVNDRFVLLKDSSSSTRYLFAAQRNSTSAPFNGVGGSCVVKVDGNVVSTRGELYDALVDGELHTLRAERVHTNSWGSTWELANYTEWKFTGIVYDLDIDGVHFFPNQNGSWEEQDQNLITTNAPNITVEDASRTIPQSAAINWNRVPLPAPFSGDRLAPERDALDGIDALGNPIENPRPSSDTLNLFGDGEYADISSSDSLNLGAEATWELWGNFYGVRQEYYIVKHGQYAIGKESAGTYPQAADEVRVTFGNVAALNELSGLTDSFGCLHIVFDAGTLEGYWNGQKITKNYLAGQLPPTLAELANNNNVTIGAFEGTTPVAFTDNQLAGVKIYSKALNAEEILQNYNAQKFKYGL